MPLNKKQAKEITGGLSKPSKMPGPCFNLPASRCITGAKLVKIPGSVCYGCYALKGRYRFGNVQKALERRRQALSSPRWVEAMVILVSGNEFFRWHDSGDIQSVEHLKNIFEVCKRTPETRHWLPTREAKFLTLMDPEVVPKNLIIRFSSHMIDQGPVSFWPWTSTVVTKDKTCPAAEQGNTCGSCRACWSRDVKNIAYGKH
tara:strand:+ start:1742 stop:2347 length:606 start_codon:yes stop_codon:yes gene_type:complete